MVILFKDFSFLAFVLARNSQMNWDFLLLFANTFALGLSLKIVFSMSPPKTQCSNGLHFHPLLYVFFIQVVLMIFMLIFFFGAFSLSYFLMAFILVLIFVSFDSGYFEGICPCPFIFCLHDIHLVLVVFVFSGILIELWGTSPYLWALVEPSKLYFISYLSLCLEWVKLNTILNWNSGD